MLKITVEFDGSNFSPENDDYGNLPNVQHEMVFRLDHDPIHGPTFQDVLLKFVTICDLVSRTLGITKQDTI